MSAREPGTTDRSEVEERKRQAAREDEEMRRTGRIVSERQVFELAREYFGREDGAA